jgi:hypothetical protein
MVVEMVDCEANMHVRLFLSTLIALFIFGTSVAAEPPATRRWTDRTGKFSTDAELVVVNKDSVVLKNAKGKVITVPLARLSDADREYLKTLATPDAKSSQDRASANLTFPDALTEPPAGNVAPVRWPGIERYPLRPDGTPDFKKYVLNLYRKGVTPENNAAVLLWQVVRPSRQEEIYRELGLAGPLPQDVPLETPSGDAQYQRVLEWLRERSRRESNVTPEINEIVAAARQHPWTSELLPPFAEWVRKNKEALDRIVAATRRPRYYSPPVDLLIESNQPLEDSLRQAGLSQVAQYDLVPAVMTRAMWHLGEGRLDEARSDIMAIHRLARLIDQQLPIVPIGPQFAARVVDLAAHEATLTLVSEGNLSAAQGRELLRELSALSHFKGMGDSFDTLQRATFLDIVLKLKTRRTRVEPAGSLDVSTLAQLRRQSYVFLYEEQHPAGKDLKDFLDRLHAAAREVRDWDAVLHRCNDHFDRLVAAARMPPGAARKEALAQIEAERETHSAAESQLGAFTTLSQKDRTSVFASALITFLGPIHQTSSFTFDVPARSVIWPYDDPNTRLELTRLAAALAVYRAENAQYPEKLDELVPGVLANLPLDAHNGLLFRYRRDGEGYLLYGIGANGRDEGGSSAHGFDYVFEGRRIKEMGEDEARAARGKIPSLPDDWSIRLPRPAFDWSELLSPP